MMPPLTLKWKLLSVRALLPAILFISLTACGFVGFPGVYRIDVEQGNIVTQEMVDQLKPAMSRRQVRFIMGTPLMEDSFNQDRWDYPYSIRNGGDVIKQSHVSVFFEGDSLVSVSGDLLPAWASTAPAAEAETEAEADSEEVAD